MTRLPSRGQTVLAWERGCVRGGAAIGEETRSPGEEGGGTSVKGGREAGRPGARARPYLFDQHSRAPLPGHRLPSQVQRSWVETWGLGSMQDSQESMHWCRARTGRGRLWELREGTLSPVGVLQR